MLINVDRITSNDDATLGVLRVNGIFSCFTLEDEPREEKIAGETRIPSGKYKVRLKRTGSMHIRYRQKFHFHQGMLHLQDVRGFTDILIHIGNTDDDTAGCLLVGAGCDTYKKLFVSSSTLAYARFYKAVVDAAAEGGLYIYIADID